MIRGGLRGPAAILVLVLAGTACGGKGDQSGKANPTPSASAPAAPALCPLTGAPAPNGVDVSRPTLAVKIDNAPQARPQAGLEASDIVYEELAEGGITRFLAIFHCKDAARLGPVRSARLVDPDILVQYKPVLFGYSGANVDVLPKVTSTPGIVDLRHGSHGAAYQRVKGRPGTHDLFTSTDKLRALAKDVKGPPQTGLVFEAAGAASAGAAPSSPAPAGTGPAAAAPATGPGTSVTFSFAGAPDHKYTYDAASAAYLRFQGLNVPFNTESAGQVKASNVVFMKVKVVPGAIKDAAGNLSPDITVVGSGEAIVLRGGVSIKGKWSRPGPGDQTKLVDAAGNPIKLAPGNTWFHLVPEGQAINVS